MALTDPQAVTYDGTAYSLARVPNAIKDTSLYRDADEKVFLGVQQQNGKRKRHVVKLNVPVVITDPVTGLSVQDEIRASFTVDRPTWGTTTAGVKKVTDALTAYVTASTGANLMKVVGGEQ